MALIEEDDRAYLAERFAKDMRQDITIEFFSRSSFHANLARSEPLEPDQANITLQACQVSYQLYKELAELSDRLNLLFQDLDTASGQQAAAAAGIDPALIPATVYRSGLMGGMSRFFGIPTGYEFGTLVENLIDQSSGQNNLAETTRETLSKLDSPAHIKVFVTPT